MVHEYLENIVKFCLITAGASTFVWYLDKKFLVDEMRHLYREGKLTEKPTFSNISRMTGPETRHLYRKDSSPKQ